MSSLRKVSHDFILEEIKDKDVCTIKLNKEDSIVFYDKESFNKYFETKFLKKYNDILSLIDEDDTSSDADLVRSKFIELNNMLKNKFSKYLDERTIKKYSKMLLLLNEKVKSIKQSRSR